MKRIEIPFPDTPAGNVSLQLDETSGVQASMIHQIETGGYEPATWAAIRAIVRPGDRVVDVGAHVGVLSCLMAALVGPAGSVYAFEPHPGNFARLAVNVALNGFSQVSAYQVACGARMGESALFENFDNDGGHALYDPRAWDCNTKTRLMPTAAHLVTTYPLDAIVHEPARLIKIDTEGAELEVLRGAERHLGGTPAPHVILEVNRFGLLQLSASERALRDLLCTRFGYAPYLLWDFGGEKLRLLPVDGYLKVDVVFNMLFLPPGAEVPCVS